MRQELLKQLQDWHQQSKYKRIIEAIQELNNEEVDYELKGHLARAYNNADQYDKAIEVLQSVQDEGAQDPLWHFRMGYAHYYGDRVAESLPYFERAYELDPQDTTALQFCNMARPYANFASSGQGGADENRAQGTERGTAQDIVQGTVQDAVQDTVQDTVQGDALTARGELQHAAQGTKQADSHHSKLSPFIWVEHASSVSVILNAGEYKADLFAERADEGFEGSGYDWGSLAAVFLTEDMPELQAAVRFDPEAGMFCAYSSDREALYRFAAGFKAACEDDGRIRDLFSRAELD